MRGTTVATSPGLLSSRVAVAALIAEARRRARRRHRRYACAAMLVTVVVAAVHVNLPGGGGLPPAGADARPAAWNGALVFTLTGHIAGDLRRAGVRYRESGTLTVRWSVPPSRLVPGRRFRSSSVRFVGTARATGAVGAACTSRLVPRVAAISLLVTDVRFSSYLGARTTSFAVSPNPLARLTSPRCPEAARAEGRTLASYMFRRPGFGFYGGDFRPIPKGGNGDGVERGFGLRGSASWVTTLSVAPERRSATYREVLLTGYSPLPALFLKAVGPCTSNQFPACRRTDGTVKRAVDAFRVALTHVRPSAALAAADRELRAGLAAFDLALAKRIRLAHQATIGPFINADSDIVIALNLLDRAARDLNRGDPSLQLTPI